MKQLALHIMLACADAETMNLEQGLHTNAFLPYAIGHNSTQTPAVLLDACKMAQGHMSKQH